MWKMLKMLLFGGEPDRDPDPAGTRAPTRTERLAPVPEPMEDRAQADAPLSAGKKRAGVGRSHMQNGGGISPVLAENLKALKRVFGSSGDIIFRAFTIDGLNIRACLVYLNGLVENPSVNDFILRPLMQRGDQLQQAMTRQPSGHLPGEEGAPAHPLLRHVQELLVVNSAMPERTQFTLLVDDILTGSTALLIDGVPAALTIPQIGFEERNVQEPPTEALVRGPRDGFVESIRTNMALLRRKLRDPNLRLELLRVGRRTNTDVVIAYIQDVANLLRAPNSCLT